MLVLERLENKKMHDVVAPVVEKIHKEHVISRIWDFDHTVWKPEPTEIANRLGWLRIVDDMINLTPELMNFVRELKQDGYTHAVMLGMGGSSLASDVFRRVFEKQDGYLMLSVLDSTDPDAVQRCLTEHDLSTTLFIVATKSGGTAETLSFFKFFYNIYLKSMNSAEAGQHFVAITDSGSSLAKLADRLQFRQAFLNDATIGGRFSVLSYFGLVPAALMGVDIPTLLSRAKYMMAQCAISDDNLHENPAVILGATLGGLAEVSIDKATFIGSKSLAPFGDWVEQLVAESTGKEGKGILPVVDEPLGGMNVYGADRVFVVQHLRSETDCDAILTELHHADFPVLHLILDDLYDLGALFFLWEMATAVAGYCLGIQPFDQPNVEMAKRLARVSIDQYMETGTLDIGHYADLDAQSIGKFLANVEPGHYIALQAYLAPSLANDQALTDLQVFLRNKYRVPVTKGYGPRFLHSTGQLHKGDAGHGLFIQFVSENKVDVFIPDEPGRPESSMTFGVLKMAQALGDYQALRDVHRRVIRFLVTGQLNDAVGVLTS